MSDAFFNFTQTMSVVLAVAYGVQLALTFLAPFTIRRLLPPMWGIVLSVVIGSAIIILSEPFFGEALANVAVAASFILIGKLVYHAADAELSTPGTE